MRASRSREEWTDRYVDPGWRLEVAATLGVQREGEQGVFYEDGRRSQDEGGEQVHVDVVPHTVELPGAEVTACGSLPLEAGLVTTTLHNHKHAASTAPMLHVTVPEGDEDSQRKQQGSQRKRVADCVHDP